MNKILALGAEGCIVERVRTRSAQVRFLSGNITVAKTWHSDHDSLFIVKEGRTLSTSVESEDDFKRVKSLVDMCRLIPPNNSFKGLYDKKNRVKNPVDMFCEPTDLVNMAEEAMAGVADSGAPNCAGVVYYQHVNRELVSSSGPQGVEDYGGFEVSARAFFNDDETGHAYTGHAQREGVNAKKVGVIAGENALLARSPGPGKPGIYDVVLAPLFTANILNRIAHFSSAFNIQIGMSPFCDMMGKRVASENISVKDAGIVEGSIGSHAFDQEGCLTAKTPLIENGVMTGTLHNSSTAKAQEGVTTGNAGLVVPMPWNTLMEPGNHDMENLCQELGNGLLLTNTWYTRFQSTREGVFSTMPRDAIIVIKNGEMAGSLKGMRLMGQFNELLKNVEAVGKEAEQVRSWGQSHPSFAPAMLVRNVRLTGLNTDFDVQK